LKPCIIACGGSVEAFELLREGLFIGQGACDDLAHVFAQIGLGGHAGDGFASGTAVRLCELLPAV